MMWKLFLMKNYSRKLNKKKILFLFVHGTTPLSYSDNTSILLIDFQKQPPVVFCEKTCF